MSIAVIIPARFGSTRLPGKPLVEIAGIPLLERVIHQARRALAGYPDTRLMVATEDKRIAFFAERLGVEAHLTPDSCPSGSDRVYAVYEGLDRKPEVIVNLQGDVPLVEPAYIKSLIDTMLTNPDYRVATPVVQLSWAALDKLEQEKLMTPFSGTTAILDKNNQAVWFSKNIIPAIRKRSQLEKTEKYSPVFKHVGLYAYRPEALEEFCKLAPSPYEKLEGLEQLRFLENGVPIHCVAVQELAAPIGIGVDSPEDVARVEQIIASYGDPFQIGEEAL